MTYLWSLQLYIECNNLRTKSNPRRRINDDFLHLISFILSKTIFPIQKQDLPQSNFEQWSNKGSLVINWMDKVVFVQIYL